MVSYCAILGVWFPGCLLFRSNFVLKSAVGSVALVRCPESFRNKECVRCREVVRYRRFDCIPGPFSTVFIKV